MSGSRIAIVWNPSKTSREDLERALPASAADAEVSWHETTPDDPGQGATGEALAAGAAVVVAAGGDGTVRAVAERLAQGASAELAIVPLGTGNLLARNLGVPLGLAGALTRAFEGESRALDIGWITAEVDGAKSRQAFAVLAGIGLDAHMIVETDEDLKSKVGWLAYVESLGRALSASAVVKMAIAVDGAAPERAEGHTLLVGNCGTLQGGIALLPDADPSDGELDLLLLSAEGMGQWLDTLRSFMWDNGIRRLFSRHERAESADTATHGRVRRVTVELAEPRVLEVDGDDLGETAAFTIEVQPEAVRVRCDAAAKQ
ncbi:diacylglycerol/lipid kinase family protein [Glycomyces algeriensis]|uniref:Sphingosine kinase n=1 Tax=Glycomyces algeriensis TaxID=256037 RepID=A0A9W6GCY8_9ACTN|nr:diacylglycerol kinase family protein [Glycomyces algeriensis]MDA1368353.1 diacylglycerol kinase family protein [Glycomyces algeriensis]MDR7351795.1 diacylglycerol kinase family enzyme [Glycomyces algeriensis]GLI44522.1 sphingosine kinase [Glycomyces algeriensis]